MFDSKAKIAGTTHKAQRLDVILGIDPIARIGAQGGADQPGVFVVADHFG